MATLAPTSPAFAPAPIALPLTPGPYFGYTPTEQVMQSAIPSLQKAPTVTGPSVAAYGAAQAAPINWLGQLTGGAVGAGNDPRTWSPDQAAAQTDRALARIGQANPELAQTLAAQHGVGQEPQDGGGFLHGLLGAAGKVLHVTHLDTVFDYLGRGAHIVPEILDHPDQSVWTSMATALDGHSTTSWDDVLADRFGIKHSLLSSVLGLGLDLVSDPLTYLTFGAGALGRDAIAKGVSVAGIEAAGQSGALGAARELGTVWGKASASVAAGLGEANAAKALASGTFDTTVAKAIFGLTEPGGKIAEEATAGFVGKVRTALGAVHPDAKSAALLTMSDISGKEAITSTIEMADKLFTTASTIGWQRATAEAAAKMGIDKSAVDEVLKTYISHGTGVGVDKSAYELGKAAAAARGGVRLRLSIPVVDLRMAGQRLPFLPARLDFSAGRRFFAGMSGEVRMMKMLGTRADVTMDHVSAFWQGGWKGLKNFSEANGDSVASDVGRGVRSMFYTASEGVGGATAHLSAHAKVLRGGGLAARYSAEASTMGAHIRSQTIGDIQRVTLGEGDAAVVLDSKSFGERLGKGQVAAADQADHLTEILNEYSTLVPQGQTAKNAYEAQRKLLVNAIDQGTVSAADAEGTLKRLDEKAARAVAVEKEIAQLTGDEQYGEIWRQAAHNNEDAILNAGQLPDTISGSILERNDLSKEDLDRLSQDGQAFRFETVSAGSPIGVDELGDVTEDGIALRGLHGTADGAIGDSPDVMDKASLLDISRSVATDPGDPRRMAFASLKPGTTAEVEAQLKGDELAAFRAARVAREERVAGKIEEPVAAATPAADLTTVGAPVNVEGLQAEANRITDAAGLPRVKVEVGKTAKTLHGKDLAKADYDEATNTIRFRANPDDTQSQYDLLVHELGHHYHIAHPELGDTGRMAAHHGQGFNKAHAAVQEIAGPASAPAAARRNQLTAVMEKAEELAAARRATLTKDQTDFLLRPRAAFVGPRRTLRLDRSGNAAEAAVDVSVDPVADFQSHIQPVLEAMAAGKHPDLAGLPEDMQRTVRKYLEEDGNFTAQMADLTTQYVKDLGYTDVQILGKDGKTRVVALMGNDGNVPVARINPSAARVAEGGPTLRAVTPDVRQLIEGVDKSGNAMLVRQVLRATAGLDPRQAEARATRMLDEAGVKLAAAQHFFETKPLSIIESATSETSNRVVREFMGRAMRDAENLGLTRGGYGAGLVGATKYRYVAMEGTAAADYFERLGRDEQQARRTAAKVSDEHLAEMQVEAHRLNDEFVGRQKEYQDLADNQSAREQAILDITARKRNDMDIHPERNAEYIDATNRRVQWIEEHLDELRPGQEITAEGATMAGGLRGQIFEGWGHVRDFTREDGTIGSVWRLDLRMKLGGGRFENAASHIYLARDESGWVHATREVEPSAIGPEQVQRVLDHGGNPAAYRSVTAITHPESERQGWGAALHSAHWDEAGIHSPEDMKAAITYQSLSKSGEAFNMKQFRIHYQELQADTAKQAKQAKAAAEKAAKAFDDAKLEHDGAMAELNKMFFRSQHDRAPALVALHPAEGAKNMTGFARVSVPGFEDYAMPGFMAQEFEHAMRGFPKLDGAHRAFRQFNSWWKTAATWLWPGFHIRNIEGAFFNNWLGGVGLKSYGTAFRIRMAAREIATGEPGKWAKRAVTEKDGAFIRGLQLGHPEGVLYGKPIRDLTYGDLHAMTSGLNLTASNGRAFAEAMLPAEAEARKWTTRRRFTDRITPFYTKPMRGAGTMTENIMRLASWSHSVSTGRSIWESRAFTMMRHGDYEDLTDFEYSVVRDLIPFYKWMRTNTPFQVHQLLESPGKLLAVQKAQRAVFSAAGLDYEQEQHRMPSWMGDSFIVPWGKKLDPKTGLSVYDTVNFDLPMADMFMSGREFVSSFLPTVRPFLESYVYHQQTFSGKPLTGKPVPLNPILTPLSGLLGAVGLTERGTDGRPYITDQTNNILSIIPIYSRFKDWVMGDSTNVEKRSHALASAAFGLALRPVDAAALSGSELSFYYDQVLPTMEYMKALGYNLPTTDDLAAVGKTTDTILSGLGIQPGPVAATAA